MAVSGTGVVEGLRRYFGHRGKLIVISNSEAHTETVAMGSPELWHRGSTKIAITVPNRLVRRVSCCESFRWGLRTAALDATEFPALPFLRRKD